MGSHEILEAHKQPTQWQTIIQPDYWGLYYIEAWEIFKNSEIEYSVISHNNVSKLGPLSKTTTDHENLTHDFWEVSTKKNQSWICNAKLTQS